MYLDHKATALHRLFLQVHSQDNINDNKKAKDHEGPEEVDTGDMDDTAGSLPMLSDDENKSDSGGEE